MKLTNKQLKRLIKEEVQTLLQEKGVSYGQLSLEKIKSILDKGHSGQSGDMLKKSDIYQGTTTYEITFKPFTRF